MHLGKIVVAIAVSVALCTSGCSAETAGNHDKTDFSLSPDTVLAMRFSPYSYEVENESQSGYVGLANADGNIQISDVGYMNMGQILWGDNTLFFWWPK